MQSASALSLTQLVLWTLWAWSSSTALIFTICATWFPCLLPSVTQQLMVLSGFKNCIDVHRRESLWAEKRKNVWLKKPKEQTGDPKSILGSQYYIITTAVHPLQVSCVAKFIVMRFLLAWIPQELAEWRDKYRFAGHHQQKRALGSPSFWTERSEISRSSILKAGLLTFGFYTSNIIRMTNILTAACSNCQPACSSKLLRGAWCWMYNETPSCCRWAWLFPFFLPIYIKCGSRAIHLPTHGLELRSWSVIWIALV